MIGECSTTELRSRVLTLLRLGVPMTIAQIARALSDDQNRVRKRLDELARERRAERIGYRLVRLPRGGHAGCLWQLTAEEYIPRARL